MLPAPVSRIATRGVCPSIWSCPLSVSRVASDQIRPQSTCARLYCTKAAVCRSAALFFGGGAPASSAARVLENIVVRREVNWPVAATSNASKAAIRCSGEKPGGYSPYEGLTTSLSKGGCTAPKGGSFRFVVPGVGCSSCSVGKDFAS